MKSGQLACPRSIPTYLSAEMREYFTLDSRQSPMRGKGFSSHLSRSEASEAQPTPFEGEVQGEDSLILHCQLVLVWVGKCPSLFGPLPPKFLGLRENSSCGGSSSGHLHFSLHIFREMGYDTPSRTDSSLPRAIWKKKGWMEGECVP